MTIKECPECGGNHFGSTECPMGKDWQHDPGTLASLRQSLAPPDHATTIAALRAALAAKDAEIARLLVEIEAARQFGGGFYGATVRDGVREVYRTMARAALKEPPHAE